MTPTEFDGDDLDERYVNGPKLRSRTTTHDDGTVECTIYPADSTDDRTTQWITAQEGSYVDLCRMR